MLNFFKKKKEVEKEVENVTESLVKMTKEMKLNKMKELSVMMHKHLEMALETKVLLEYGTEYITGEIDGDVIFIIMSGNAEIDVYNIHFYLFTPPDLVGRIIDVIKQYFTVRTNKSFFKKTDDKTDKINICFAKFNKDAKLFTDFIVESVEALVKKDDIKIN